MLKEAQIKKLRIKIGQTVDLIYFVIFVGSVEKVKSNIKYIKNKGYGKRRV